MRERAGLRPSAADPARLPYRATSSRYPGRPGLPGCCNPIPRIVPHDLVCLVSEGFQFSHLLQVRQVLDLRLVHSLRHQVIEHLFRLPAHRREIAVLVALPFEDGRVVLFQELPVRLRVILGVVHRPPPFRVVEGQFSL